MQWFKKSITKEKISQLIDFKKLQIKNIIGVLSYVKRVELGNK